METGVLAAVLFGALLHATWNAVARAARGRGADAVLIAVGAGVLALPGAFLLPTPARASWLALGVSAVIHVLYFRLVAIVYRGGALSVAYPLMRGLPPLAVAVVAAAMLGDRLPPAAWLGVAVLAAGVMTVGGDGLRARSLAPGTLAVILLNVGVIVVYTLVDGIGARASGNALGYAAWLFALTAIGLLPFLRAAAIAEARARPLPLVVGSLCTLGAYGIALWAMTRAPIGLVAAVRETSVLFAAALGALVLHERFGRLRWAGVAFTAAGLVAVRVS
jgi:drug/metabolite transporter (DMT)-like permease